MTIGELKEIIKDMPNDTPILQQDPFSEYSYDNVDVYKAYSSVGVTQKNGDIWYWSWLELIEKLENWNGRKVKIIFPKKYKDVLVNAFCGRKVEYEILNNSLYVISERDETTL